MTTFITTIAQTLGPEALMQYINPSEAIKRLAAAQGIDILNLVKTEQQLQAEQQQQQQAAQQQALMEQAGQFAGTPMADPSKNPMLASAMSPQDQEPPTEE